MKRFLLAVLVVIFFAVPVQAQFDPTLTTLAETYYVPDATSGASSFAGNAVTPYMTTAIVQVEGGPLRYYLNGNTPTTKIGYLAYDGDFLPVYTPYDVLGLRFIPDSTAAAGGTTVFVTFKGRRR